MKDLFLFDLLEDLTNKPMWKGPFIDYIIYLSTNTVNFCNHM